MKSKSHNRTKNAGLGILIGLVAGAAIGAASDNNMGVMIAIGLAIGAGLGFGSSNDKS